MLATCLAIFKRDVCRQKYVWFDVRFKFVYWPFNPSIRERGHQGNVNCISGFAEDSIGLGKLVFSHSLSGSVMTFDVSFILIKKDG